jgi:hypothetical protein
VVEQATEEDAVEEKRDEPMDDLEGVSQTKSAGEKRPDEKAQDRDDAVEGANPFAPATLNPNPNQWVARRRTTTRRVTVE